MQADEAGAYLAGQCLLTGSGGCWFSKYKDSLYHLYSKREGVLTPPTLRICVCDETITPSAGTVHMRLDREKVDKHCSYQGLLEVLEERNEWIQARVGGSVDLGQSMEGRNRRGLGVAERPPEMF